MNSPIWQSIINGLKALIYDIEQALENGGHALWDIIVAVFTAEEAQIMADIKPMIQQIAVNLQNSQPGLNAATFIPALVAAALPVLTKEGVVLAQTALHTLCAAVAHELNIPDTSGNQGNVNG